MWNFYWIVAVLFDLLDSITKFKQSAANFIFLINPVIFNVSFYKMLRFSIYCSIAEMPLFIF